MTRHSARASPALRALTEQDPALAALSLWCGHRDAEEGVAESEGGTIHYGPGFAALPLHEQVGLAGHHILHVALRHSQRMAAMRARFGGAFDALTYNAAADAIVNEALLLAGHALPRPALRLTGLLESLGALSGPAEALAAWDADRLYIRLMAGGAGEGGSDRVRAHLRAQGFGRDLKPVRAAPEAAEQRLSEADWRQHLTRAMEAGRMGGRGVGMLGHRLADIPQPRTPWEVVLRRLVTRAVTQAPRPDGTRPSRQWIAGEADALRQGRPRPAFQPGLRRSTGIPRIAVALDTSSSIDDARMALFVAEVAGIAARARAELHVIPFDEAVQGTFRLDPAAWRGQLAGLAMARGGGTAFAPAIAAAAALAPSVIILMTDLEGEAGPDPRLPVIWAVPDAAEPPRPPFGTVLSLAS